MTGTKAMNGAGGPWARKASVRYVVSFVAISGVLFAIYNFPYPAGSVWNVFYGYLRFYAFTAGSVLRMFEPGVRVTGVNIIGRTSLSIVRGCDGAEVVMLFGAAVASTHLVPWRARLVGLAAGWTVITAANVIRICCLYYVNLFAPASFDFFHLEVWPLFLIVLAVGCFLVWARWARRFAAEEAA